jgi:hypothetical protein
MIKSIIRKLRNTKPIHRCSKCGTPDSNDDYSDYFYLERSRGRDFEDGYEIFAGGWYCKKCDHYEWLIPNDNDWLATQDPDVVLPDAWKLYNDKRIADAK